ncbi:MAG: aldo/keto reductase [Bdellovibrionota bacterium]
MFKGKATQRAAEDYLKRHGVNPAQMREFCGIPVSALALGTYLGGMDEVTDSKVTQACLLALELGCNFFDSAINYRAQRAERSIGEALRRAILSGKAKREEIFVSTKGGFVPFESQPVPDVVGLFEDRYVKTGVANRADLIAGCHCMEPAYIENQIDRSRANLQLETIDLYYLHNPETQLEELPERLFYEKLEKAFIALEKAVQSGRIGAYGMATWSAFREELGAQTAVQLERCVVAAERAAESLGLEKHHFAAIQTPLNLAMPEAALIRTQRLGQDILPAIDAAHVLGLSVAVSVPLFQARLCHGLPDFIVEKFPERFSQAQCALSFATAFASVDVAMVGMKMAEHVRHNLEFLRTEGLSEGELKSVIEAMVA